MIIQKTERVKNLRKDQKINNQIPQNDLKLDILTNLQLNE